MIHPTINQHSRMDHLIVIPLNHSTIILAAHLMVEALPTTTAVMIQVQALPAMTMAVVAEAALVMMAVGAVDLAVMAAAVGVEADFRGTNRMEQDQRLFLAISRLYLDFYSKQHATIKDVA